MDITPFRVIQGHRFWYHSKVLYDFLLVINTNLAPILHRFRDIAFDRSKVAIFAFGYPSCVSLLRRRGSAETISVKFYLDVSRRPTYTKRRRNIAENFNCLSRAQERCRSTTDERTDGWHSLKTGGHLKPSNHSWINSITRELFWRISIPALKRLTRRTVMAATDKVGRYCDVIL